MKKTTKLAKEEDPALEEIKKELDMDARTQCPPSEELIRQLNKKASSPPFSWIYKLKDRNIR
jgi:hypothetical protein